MCPTASPRILRDSVFVSPLSQNVHTAGVIAAYYGKLALIKHLQASKGLKVTQAATVSVCLICSPIAKLCNPFCTFDHLTSTTASLVHAAVCGDQKEVLNYVLECGADVDVRDSVRAYS